MAAAYGYIAKPSPSGEPPLVYVNGLLSDTTLLTSISPDPAAEYSSPRTDAILTDLSKYYGSLIRAQINGPGLNIPVFQCRVQTGQANVNLSVYSFTLTLGATYDVPAPGPGPGQVFNSTPAQVFLVWIAQNQDAPLPLSPVVRQDISTQYYDARDIQWVVGLMNVTLASCMANIQAQFNAWWLGLGGVAPPTLTTEAPWLRYDPSSGLMTLYADVYGFGGADRTSAGSLTADEFFELYMNSQMHGLLAGFPIGKLVDPVESGNLGRTYNFIVFNDLGGNIFSSRDPTVLPQGAAPYLKNYYAMTQTFISTGAIWSPFDGVVFTASGWPVNSESVDAPQRFGTGSGTAAAGSQTSTESQITDIVVDLERADSTQGQITYLPTAEYRLFSMGGAQTDLRNIGIKFWWRNRLDGSLIPLRIYPGSSISFKLMFRKRDFGA